MPPIPPTPLIVETLRDLVLPAAGGAALILGLFLTLGRWAGCLGSAAAVVAGFVWANFTLDTGGEAAGAIEWERTSRIIPWLPDKPTWHSLPRAALVLVLVGLASRGLGLIAHRALSDRWWWVERLLVWVPRWVALLVVGSWVMPVPWAEAYPWSKAALAATMLLSWVVLDGTARGGAGSQVALALAAMFFAAGGVTIFAHSKLFMDAAVVLGAAFFGIAVIARVGRVDASGAIPAGVAFLPALLVNARYQSESLVPLSAFWLVGLAPLALLPGLIPRVGRLHPLILGAGRMILVLIPLFIAVELAMANEQLPPPEEW